MRTAFPVVAAGILALAASSRASANEPWSIQLNSLNSAVTAEQLEKTAQQLQKLNQAAQRLAQRAMVNCGMTLVPPDPKLDARIRIPGPAAGVTPTIRTVTPPVCRPEATRRFTVPMSPRR